MQIIKWTSLIFICISAYSFGNLISKKYVNRYKELKDFKIALGIIESKINFTKEPIKEIFMQIISNLETNIKNIFKVVIDNTEKESLSTIWQKSINANTKILSLTKEDIEIIKGFGNMLGKTDVSGQIGQIKVTQSFIEKQIQKAEEEKNKNEKMFKTLGAIVGIGIVIILI